MTFTRIDPLLPDAVDPGEGERLRARTPEGREVTAVVYRARHDGWSALWHPRVVWELTPVSPGIGATGMAALLAALRDLLRLRRPGPDSACSVTWPSRDLDAAGALAAHGYAPYSVLAVRDAARETDAVGPPGVPERTSGIEVRPVEGGVDAVDAVDAGGAVDAVVTDLVALWLAERRYAVAVGAAVARDDAPALVERELRRAISAGDPMWMAEAEGVLAGLALCRWPSAGTRLPSGTWAQLHTVSVAPGARGRGIGRALVSAAHERLLARGARGTYVFYSPHNALSSVFWHRLGYRPLWTTWEVRPAAGAR